MIHSSVCWSADAINLSGTLVSKQDFKYSMVGKLAFGLWNSGTDAHIRDSHDDPRVG